MELSKPTHTAGFRSHREIAKKLTNEGKMPMFYEVFEHTHRRKMTLLYLGLARLLDARLVRIPHHFLHRRLHRSTMTNSKESLHAYRRVKNSFVCVVIDAQIMAQTVMTLLP